MHTILQWSHMMKFVKKWIHMMRIIISYYLDFHSKCNLSIIQQHLSMCLIMSCGPISKSLTLRVSMTDFNKNKLKYI